MKFRKLHAIYRIIVGFLQCRYEEQLERFCEFMDSLLDSRAPEIRRNGGSLMDHVKDKLHKSTFWSQVLQHAYKLGQKDMVYVFFLFHKYDCRY